MVLSALVFYSPGDNVEPRQRSSRSIPDHSSVATTIFNALSLGQGEEMHTRRTHHNHHDCINSLSEQRINPLFNAKCKQWNMNEITGLDLAHSTGTIWIYEQHLIRCKPELTSLSVLLPKSSNSQVSIIFWNLQRSHLPHCCLYISIIVLSGKGKLNKTTVT